MQRPLVRVAALATRKQRRSCDLRAIRLLRVTLMLLSVFVFLPGCTHAPERLFAYVDGQRRLSVNELGTEEPVWQSSLKMPLNGAPAWSPDGNRLGYVCVDELADVSYPALLSTDLSPETLIEIPGKPNSAFENGATIEWAPSAEFVGIEDWGYPPCPVIIIDLSVGEILLEYTGDGLPLWSCDSKQAAYVVIKGRFIVGPEGPLFHCELLVFDTVSTESRVLVTGETAYLINPEQWSEQGAIVYRYVDSDGSDKQKLDTMGTVYEYPRDELRQATAAESPLGFPADLGRVRSTDRDETTGEWLVAASKDDQTWIYHYVEGTNPVRLLKGTHPAWFPGKITPAIAVSLDRVSK